MTGIRINFNYETLRWMVDTPIAMNKHQLLAVMTNAKAQLSIRAKGEIGDKRKRMQWAIDNMSFNNIDQYLTGGAEEKTLYISPEKVKQKTMIIR
jgi:predicted RNA-binding protein with RPS1 domain